jgi:hypothetical protein
MVGAMLLALFVGGSAHGERSQEGNLILSLDGGLSPLVLPRSRPAPVAIRLAGRLQTADGAVLPRVTQIELGLPRQGVISTRGLPLCSQRRLRDAKSPEALAACRSALVGRGQLDARVALPNQEPFGIHARLLAFNGKVEGRRAVIVHAYAADPPTSVVLPFLIRRREGELGLALVATLPSALGPWPHLAHFKVTLSRRFHYRGHERSYLSATCPIPRALTAGYATARARFTLADGRRLGTEITRSCRAR